MNPRYKFQLHHQKLPLSEGLASTVYVKLETVAEEIHEDPVTRIQTLTESSNPDSSSPVSISFSIDSSTCQSQISDLLFVRITNSRWLCDFLASRIASAANQLGFGVNGFKIGLVLTLTYRKVVSVTSESVLQKLVCQGTIDGEELKISKIETEPCSICLENLLGSKNGVPTRMPCSHVFHDRCLLEWFCRKDTCPACRRVLSQRNRLFVFGN